MSPFESAFDKVMPFHAPASRAFETAVGSFFLRRKVCGPGHLCCVMLVHHQKTILVQTVFFSSRRCLPALLVQLRGRGCRNVIFVAAISFDEQSYPLTNCAPPEARLIALWTAPAFPRPCCPARRVERGRWDATIDQSSMQSGSCAWGRMRHTPSMFDDGSEQ